MTADRLLSADARTADLEPLPLGPEDVLAGEPMAALKPLAELGGAEVGIWQLSPGAVRDVEVDEVFVVLAGDATVTFEDGESIELRPGVVVRLKAGDRSEWHVRSTLRKVYFSA